MQKEKLDAKKILENCTIIFLFFAPVFSTIFFYNRITTLIEVICVFLINLFTLLFYKNSRKNYKWLAIYYLLCILYLVLSYKHAFSFKSLVPNNFNYNIVSEMLTVIKLITPITLLYSLFYQKIPFKKYILVLKVWTLLIAGSIIITNVFKISLGSYTNGLISKNIFEWNTKNYYQDTASKGFFMYANQCAVSLILLLLLLVYDFLYNDKKSIVYIILLTIAMLMLGTRISTIGGLLTLFCTCVYYLIYKLNKKEKINKKTLLILIPILLWVALLPISPYQNRYVELHTIGYENKYKTDSENNFFSDVITKLYMKEPSINNSGGKTNDTNSNKNNSKDENIEQEKDLKLEYIYNNFDENYLPKRFFEENYPAIYDKDFWVNYIKNTPKEQMNYRNIEKNIIKRVEDFNDNKWDIILGISNSRVQNIINIESDFVLHYYAFGILGTILLLLVYIILLIKTLIYFIKNKTYFAFIMLSCFSLFILCAYLSGNIINSLNISLINVFLMCGMNFFENNNITNDLKTLTKKMKQKEMVINMSKIVSIFNKFNENKIINIIVRFLFVLTPIIILFLIIQKNNLFNFYPAPLFGDEMGYYRVTDSFVNSNVKYGNYGVSFYGDVSAKYGGFSAHGPKYTVFYGLIGKIIGWHPYSILLINVILLVIVFFVIAKSVKLKNVQWILYILLFYSFFPLLFFYVSGMVELTQFIFILLYSVFVYKLFTNPNKNNYVLNIISIFILSLFRINYIILYLPVIFIFADKKINKKFLLNLILAFILSLFSYYFISLFSAPYPGFLSELLNNIMSLKIGLFFNNLFTHSTRILKDFFTLKVNSQMEIIFNILYVIVVGLNAILAIINRKYNKLNIYLYNFFILITSFLIIILLYEVTIFKSVRTLGPFLLLSIILLIYNNKLKSGTCIIASLFILTYFVIGFSTFRTQASYSLIHGPLISDEKSINELNELLVCEDTNNRWDNTISVPNSFSYNSNIIYGLSPCIGINYVIFNDYSNIKKSKYILVDDDTTVNKNIYQLILENKLGKLYIKYNN